MANYKNKNLLPLLAFTALLLSVSAVRYSQSLVLGNKTNQEVLSDTDEIKSQDEDNSGKFKNEVKEKDRVKTSEEGRNSEVKRIEKNERLKATEKPRTRIEIVEDKPDSDDDHDLDEKEDEVENETEVEQESETNTTGGVSSKFKLKIKTRTTAGKTIVETALGEVEVANNPEDSINNIVQSKIMDTPLSFEAKTNDKNEVEFEIQGVEEKKLFGLFDLSLTKTVTVNSTTGEVVSTKQDLWNQILNFLSVSN